MLYVAVLLVSLSLSSYASLSERSPTPHPPERRPTVQTAVLKNSSPSVIGGVVRFSAQIYNCDDPNVHRSYSWTSSVDTRNVITTGTCSSEARFLYPQLNGRIAPGLYTMYVRIKKLGPLGRTGQIINGTTVFNLTDGLNGEISVSTNQNAILSPVAMTSNISDVVPRASIAYAWFSNNLLICSKQECLHTFSKPGDHIIVLRVLLFSPKDFFMQGTFVKTILITESRDPSILLIFTCVNIGVLCLGAILLARCHDYRRQRRRQRHLACETADFHFSEASTSEGSPLRPYRPAGYTLI